MNGVRVSLRCPFCRQEESERVELPGQRMIVFPCMFSPLVGPEVAEDHLQGWLDARYGTENGYFRKQCDRLHAKLMINGLGTSG